MAVNFLKTDTLTLLNAGGFYTDAPLRIVIRTNAGKEFNKPEEYYKSAEKSILSREK